MEKKKHDTKRTQRYVDHIFELIEEKPDVMEIMILNKYKNPVKTTMDSNMSIQYAGLFGTLLEKVIMGLQKIDLKDEVLMLRVRSRAHETLIMPDGSISIIVVQNALDKI